MPQRGTLKVMNETRKEHARRLHAEGKKYREIAHLMGISPQRVHQLLTGYKSPSYRRIKENQGSGVIHS
jgi:predicted transcriptional regulator